MPRVTNTKYKEELNKVRDYINAGISEQNICKFMNISRPTFYRLKKRVIREIVKQNIIDPEQLEQETALYRKSLEDCYRINTYIAQDINKSASERTNASVTAAIARAEIVELVKKGAIPKNRVIEVRNHVMDREVVQIIPKDNPEPMLDDLKGKNS